MLSVIIVLYLLTSQFRVILAVITGVYVCDVLKALLSLSEVVPEVNTAKKNMNDNSSPASMYSVNMSLEPDLRAHLYLKDQQRVTKTTYRH